MYMYSYCVKTESFFKTSTRWNIFVNNTASGRNICRNYMNIVEECRLSFDLYLTLLVFAYKSTKKAYRNSNVTSSFLFIKLTVLQNNYGTDWFTNIK